MKKGARCALILGLAEGEGFEPPEASQLQRFSRPPLSTAQPTFRIAIV